MSLYTDTIANVYTLTNRADLVNETALAVKSATLKSHRMDYFAKDLYETGISFTTSEYIQTLAFSAIIPLFRTMKYLRKYDAVELAAGAFLKGITPEQVVDGYGIERTDVFYQAGAAIQIKSSTQEQYFLLGVYLNANVDPSAYDSWIATEYPYLIAFEAANIVLKGIGQAELGNAQSQLAAEDRDQLIRNNTEIIGS